jgi:hypothetical protein
VVGAFSAGWLVSALPLSSPPHAVVEATAHADRAKTVIARFMVDSSHRLVFSPRDDQSP